MSKKEVDGQQSEEDNAKIQCPDCGSMFELNQYGEYFCKRCNRIVTEDEIRD